MEGSKWDLVLTLPKYRLSAFFMAKTERNAP